MSEERFTTLLASARQGNEAAWTEIYRELAPALLGYMRVNGEPEPEDALGEVFLQVARDVGGFEGSWPKFRSWVFTVAHHRMIDAGRRRARRPVDLVPETPEPEGAPAADAEEAALARIGMDQVLEVLSSLSEGQRTVLLLRVIGELTVEQVAEAIGKRPGAVKQLQRRGLLAARKELAKRGVTL